LFDGPGQTIHPDGSAFVPEDYPAVVALRTGQPCLNASMGYYRPDGELVWLVLDTQPLFRTNESVPYTVITTIADVTAENRQPMASDLAPKAIAFPAQKEFRQQLAEIEAIYTAAPIGLCFIDTDLRFIRINEQLAQINGLPVSAHIGKTVRDILPEMADKLEPVYRQAIASGEPILNLEVSGTNQAQPGVERNWLVSYYPHKDTNNQVLGINVMVQEVTARKQAEAALREANRRIITAWESMTDAFTAVDKDWRIIYQNPAAERINGKPRAEVLGKTKWEEWPASVGTVFEQQYRRAMTEQVAVHFEERYYEPPDHDVWLEVHACPFDSGLGIFYRDISERKKVEAALRD
jgi:PAS domain S-box-containing protein